MGRQVLVEFRSKRKERGEITLCSLEVAQILERERVSDPMRVRLDLGEETFGTGDDLQVIAAYNLLDRDDELVVEERRSPRLLGSVR